MITFLLQLACNGNLLTTHILYRREHLADCEFADQQ